MKYLICFTLLIAATTARFPDVFGPEEPVVQFLQGFNHALNIADGEDLDKCIASSLIDDIKRTLDDISQKKPNFVALIEDFYNLYKDYKQLKNSCPKVAKIYGDFFNDFYKAFNSNPPKTLLKIFSNIGHDPVTFAKEVDSAQHSFKHDEYKPAGEHVGKAAGIALSSYIH